MYSDILCGGEKKNIYIYYIGACACNKDLLIEFRVKRDQSNRISEVGRLFIRSGQRHMRMQKPRAQGACN